MLNHQLNFLEATNNIKISIHFPSNWQLGEDLNDSENFGQKVWFMSSDRSLPIFIIYTKKLEPYLDTDTMTLKNTLQQHVQQENKLSSAIKDESSSARYVAQVILI